MSHSLEELDLNLLRNLAYLLDTANVTQAAQRAGVAQPAMSRSLAKLRRVLADPLLVPVGRRLELTSRAMALRPRVQDVLAAARLVLQPPDEFHPQTATGLVRVAASEYTAWGFLNRWITSLHSEAKGLSVHIAPADLRSLQALAEGELELALGPAIKGVEAAGVDRFVVRPLYRDERVCVVRARHPCLRRPWSVNAFAALEHVLVATGRPGLTPIDEALAQQGTKRRVAAAVPSVGIALALIAESDMAAVLPKRVLEHAPWRLSSRPVPITLEDEPTYLAWSPRFTHDARHRWLRQSLLRAAAP